MLSSLDGGPQRRSVAQERAAGVVAQPDALVKIEEAGFFWTFEGIPLEHRITIPGGGKYPDACFDHIYTRNLGRPVASVLKSKRNAKQHLKPLDFPIVPPRRRSLVS